LTTAGHSLEDRRARGRSRRLADERSESPCRWIESIRVGAEPRDTQNGVRFGERREHDAAFFELDLEGGFIARIRRAFENREAPPARLEAMKRRIEGAPFARFVGRRALDRDDAVTMKTVGHEPRAHEERARMLERR